MEVYFPSPVFLEGPFTGVQGTFFVEHIGISCDKSILEANGVIDKRVWIGVSQLRRQKKQSN